MFRNFIRIGPYRPVLQVKSRLKSVNIFLEFYEFFNGEDASSTEAGTCRSDTAVISLARIQVSCQYTATWYINTLKLGGKDHQVMGIFSGYLFFRSISPAGKSLFDPPHCPSRIWYGKHLQKTA
jgi:hypothetical protein